MITYVSHIGYTYDWPKKKLSLKKTQFELYFKKKKLINDNCKKPFLRKNFKFHDIVFYKNKNWNFGFELINYKKNFQNQNVNTINNHKTANLDLDKINKLKKLYLNSSNVLSDYKLFKNMNFLLNIKFKKNTFHGNLPNFKRKKTQLVVKKNINKTKIYLDDLGFNFISFFSTNIKDDLKRIKKKEINYISKIFKLKINNNILRIVLIRTSGDIIIELIEKR